MVKTIRTYYPPGINMYVPGAQYSSDLTPEGVNYFSLGTPALGAADDIALGIVANAAALTETVITTWTADSPYGRLIISTPSADTGAAGVYDVHGYDYLGQYMIERFTHGGGAGAAVNGKKAFYKVIKTVIVTAASNAVTYKLRKSATKLGLPYKGIVVHARENGVMVAPPAINANAIDLTDPATAITGEPRGIYTGITAFNGVLKIEVGLIPDNTVNAAGNGGLFGIKHFGG
jgi:hypothetical protein